MKRMICLLTAAAVLVCLMLTGCTERFPLPVGSVAFEQGSYADPDEPDDGYQTITYLGRIYVPFGTLKGKMKDSEAAEVLGWVSRPDFPDDQGERVIRLKATEDLLMVYYVKGIMEQPMFYRALDTAGKDITLPKYVEPLGYGIWE